MLFAQEGAAVGLVGRTLAKLDRVAKEIGLDDSRVFCAAADLSRREEAGRAVNACAEHFGGLDIVVNNAGISRVRKLLEADEVVFDELFAHNVKNPLWVAQFAIPWLRRRGGGAIVNLSTSLTFKPTAGFCLYGMSKAAVDLLTLGLALEHSGDRIRVNTICPAVVDTPIHETYTTPEKARQRKEDMARTYPLGRIGTPQDVAEAILYLASDAAAWVTGITLVLDGGRLLTK